DLRGQDILAWRANGNAYCYELIVPYDIRNSCFRIMQDDLRKLFPEYRACIKTEEKRCFVLKTYDKERLKKSSATGFNEGLDFRIESKNFIAKNLPIDLFVDRINQSLIQSIPLVNEVNEDVRLSVKIPVIKDNLTEVNDILSAYGLIVTDEIRHQPM